MERILIFVLLLSFSKSIFSQEIIQDSVLTLKQNAKWIKDFEKLNSKSKQIDEIKKKIFTDSIYIRQNGNIKIGCDVIIENEETIREAMEKANCECKIIFILSFKKASYLLDPIEYPKTNRILKLVEEYNIDEINVLKGIDALVLYGITARCGVVIMSSDSRKFKRRIKNVL